MSMRHGRPRADLKHRSHPNVPFRKPMRHRLWWYGHVPIRQVKRLATTWSGLEIKPPGMALQLLLARQCFANSIVDNYSSTLEFRLFGLQLPIQACLPLCYVIIHSWQCRPRRSVAPSLLGPRCSHDSKGRHLAVRWPHRSDLFTHGKRL